jgi:hypothetical protein
MTRFEKVNIILTLILSAIAVLLSYISYKANLTSLRISESTLKISENTYILSEKIDKLNATQSQTELKSSIYSMFTTIDMLRQNNSDKVDLRDCIKSLKEMKLILETQLKNTHLAKDSTLSEMWVELYSRNNFYIKFLEDGLKPNTTVKGVKEIIVELERKTKAILNKFYEQKGIKEE